MINVQVHMFVEEGGLVQERLGIDQDGEISLAELLTFMKLSLKEISKDVLGEEQANGFDKDPVVIVDGTQGKSLDDVKPFGQIEYVAKADVGDIMIETYSLIMDKSPVLTGEYKAHNYVLLNGNQIASNMDELRAWIDSGPTLTDKDLIRFVDIMPYARKLERHGITAQTKGTSLSSRTRTSRSKRKNRGTVIRVNQPNGVYYLTNRIIRAKYRFNSVIRFEFVSGSVIGITNDKGVNRKFKGGKKNKAGIVRGIGRSYLYPSILISVRASGAV